MNYTLGPLVFALPNDWRDDSTYAFESADKRSTAEVRVAPGSGDPQTLLESARNAYLNFIGQSLVYCDQIKVRRDDGLLIPIAEGEIREPGASRGYRFAMATFVSAHQRALLLYNAPSRPDFMEVFKNLVRSVSLGGEPAPSAKYDSTSSTRRHANFVALSLPSEWGSPDTLRFLDPHQDSVSVVVTLAEPLALEGMIQMENEVAGQIRIVSSQSTVDTTLRKHGWHGEWLVEQDEPGGTLWTVRKACYDLLTGVVVTAYGKAPKERTGQLNVGWDMVLHTMRSAEGAP